MSITVSSCFQICNSPLNISSSKMLYSFPKDKRFQKQENIQYCGTAFYDLPDAKSKRKAAFGYGNKLDFTKSSLITPSPQHYEKKSLFQYDLEKHKGQTFGLSREAMNMHGPLGQLNQYTPAPGNYSIKSTLNKNGWSLRKKTSLADDKFSFKFVPGPGSYEFLPSLNNKGNSGASIFNPTSSQRFEKDRKLKVPGPGNYDLKLGMNKDGKYFNSKNQNSRCRSFPKQQRQFFEIQSQSPGPGNYRLPSEFGYYESKQVRKTEF